jgi:hypothetical protein
MMKLSTVVPGLGALAVALVLHGCAKRVEAEDTTSTPPPDVVASYYPLAVGNQWTYLVNGRADRPVDVRVLREEDGYFVDSQEGRLKVDSFGIRDPKRYLLRGPIEVGRSWNNVVSVSSTERYQIVQAGVPCEAPAGSFQNCVRVEARNRVDQGTTIVGSWTYAPGVGMVRMELVAERNGQRVPQTWLELKSYRVQPPKS